MKLHTSAPYKSRMCPIDFWVKGHALLGIDNSQGCSTFIQRVFATRLFALMRPLLVSKFYQTHLHIKYVRSHHRMSQHWIVLYFALYAVRFRRRLRLYSLKLDLNDKYNLQLWHAKVTKSSETRFHSRKLWFTPDKLGFSRVN